MALFYGQLPYIVIVPSENRQRVSRDFPSRDGLPLAGLREKRCRIEGPEHAILCKSDFASSPGMEGSRVRKMKIR